MTSRTKSALAVTALVLAGRRDGEIDALAAAAGVEDKCIVPVAGRAMILHVLAALDASPQVARIVVSINDARVLDGLPEVAAMQASGKLVLATAQTNLVDSVFAAAETARFPVLVTTADNVLLTPQAASQFIAGAADADVAVAFTRRDAVLAAHPEGQRRFYKFSDDSYSNCNTYWLQSAASLEIAEVFRSGGQFAKHPLRIVAAFGFLNLVRFHYGIGTLDAAFRRFSRRFRQEIKAVLLEDGAVAIDVDNARTLGVAEEILSRRAQTGSMAPAEPPATTAKPALALVAAR
ncbi:GTP:adenosylcobinamide-phosphate guanylyltransferase [Novosphingobium chloroacetimidivorans]|uniref:GTP:adenosylcobinamide-phosphate guanylyltransferase n=1 Tax=Novosphingobium chloroacetimidivorans TaxID=1428314 RepID=A0A7W7K662_9SPHN|nr:NTP transferase domain-containing protein [Novosphingobium chloroacetimidivorans]MBB4856962.1 GTP:adenosylcobinamide-phosphate guanylyltransferase [Novosphingobium chloroacetimidivorans]